MTNEQMERAIEFLLEHHAKMSDDINELKEAMKRQSENLDKLTANVEAMREEMQDGFSKLILANEVTRKLAEDVARLAVQTNQRVTHLEGRVGDL